MAKRTISNSTVTSVVPKKPKRDAKWHAMMERKRRLMPRKKKTNNGEATKIAPVEVSLGGHKNDGDDGIESSHGETWLRGPLLGEGGFGSVFFAKTKTPISAANDNGIDEEANPPSVMAVKSAEYASAESLKNEQEILCKLNKSFFVVKCYGDEITKSGNGEKLYYNLLLEHCSGGSLYSRIWKSVNGLPEYEVRCYTRDIIRGLYYIHDQGYAHCDIKPGNILLVPDPFSPADQDRSRAKIADFGLAKKAYFGFDYDEDYSYSVQGTYNYLSPETVTKHVQETPADIWALGCVVIEMMSGKPAWGFEYDSREDSNINCLLRRIGHSSELPEIPSDISKDGRDFLMKCFVKDPDDRWPADMLMLHPFVSVD